MGIASRNSGIYAVTRGGGVDNSIIADPFVTTKAYSKGDLVINNGYLYKATDAIDAGEWDADKWDLTTVAASIPTKFSQLENDTGIVGMAYHTINVDDNEYTINAQPNTYYKVVFNTNETTTASKIFNIKFSSSENLYQTYVQFKFNGPGGQITVNYSIDNITSIPQNMPGAYSYSYTYLVGCLNGLTSIGAFI